MKGRTSAAQQAAEAAGRELQQRGQPCPQQLLKDEAQVHKQFVENESFKRFVGDMVYAITNP